MKIRFPKWSTVLGGLLSGASFVLQHQDMIGAIPGNTSKSVVNIASTVLFVGGIFTAMYGTPPHANTATGGVLKPGEPPVDNPAA